MRSAAADDTQIYVSINPVVKRAVDEVVNKIQTCIVEVQQWMTENMIKLNAEKKRKSNSLAQLLN